MNGHKKAHLNAGPFPVPHPEKKSRAPRAAGHYHTDGGDPIAMVSQDEDRRIPSTPDSLMDRSHPEKEKLHGKFGVESRGHEYPEEIVDSTDHTKNAFDTDARKYVEAHGNPKAPRSSFGGREY